jgi:hypothetical protein
MMVFTGEVLTITVSADQAPKECSPNLIENIGCIEVVVLRCNGVRSQKASAPIASFDGAGDEPDFPFGMDGHASEDGYDDRSHIWRPQQNRHHAGDRNVQSRSAYARSQTSGPPPPITRTTAGEPPRYTREETAARFRILNSQNREHVVDEHDALRSGRSHNEQAPAGVIGNVTIPPDAYEYGAGPLPHRAHVESDMELFAERTPSSISGPQIVDPNFLARIKEEAYRRGLEATRQQDKLEESGRLADEVKQHIADVPTHQPPGAPWPPPSYPISKAFSTAQNDSKGWRIEEAPPRRPWGPEPTKFKSYSDLGPLAPHRPRHREEAKSTGDPIWKMESAPRRWEWVADSGSWGTWGASDTVKEEKPYSKPKPSGASAWSEIDSPGARSSVMSTSPKDRQTQHEARKPRSHKAASVKTVHDVKPTQDTAADDTWSKSASDWGSVLSPRTVTSQFHDTHTRQGRAKAVKESEPTWGAAEHSPPKGTTTRKSWAASTARARKPSNSSDWPPSASQADAQQEPATSESGKEEHETKKPEPLVPPIPVPLRSENSPDGVPHSPPPAYHVATHNIFRRASRASLVADTSAPLSWGSTKVDDSSWIEATGRKPTSPTSTTG